jgi:enoyl-CoA hydratase
MTEDSSTPVTVGDAADGIRVITIDRPERRNALNFAVKNRIAQVVAELDADPEVRVIVVTGSRGYFVAGTDVAEMASLTPTDHTVGETDRMFQRLWECQTPLIAAVEGYALGGGCELALSCDLVVASRAAVFGLPEVRLGVMPGAGGTQRLVRIVGKYQALRMLLTGDTVDGTRAFELGLVSELSDPGAALDAALDLARRISSMPGMAVKGILDVVEAGADLPLTSALRLERKQFQLLFDTHDQKEGMAAFLEKRPPLYTDR